MPTNSSPESPPVTGTLPDAPPPERTHKSNLCTQIKMVSLPVYVAVMLFAMSTWVAIVGVWVEMPLLVNSLPESWNLPSYLVIIIQCANLGPAIYTTYEKLRPKRNDKKETTSHCCSFINTEIAIAFLLILIAIGSTLMMSLFWPRVTYIGGASHCTALLILVSFAALASCTSSVVFLPYMARFPSVYISAYYFGQGLCGLIPGFVGLIQGAGQEPDCLNSTQISNDSLLINGSFTSTVVVQYRPPRFSVSLFFAFICLLLCIACVSFFFLNFISSCRKVQQSSQSNKPSPPVVANNNHQIKYHSTGNEDVEDIEVAGLLPSPHSKASDDPVNHPVSQPLVPMKSLPIKRQRLLALLTIVAVVSALSNGILPATQAYTCLPYGSIVYTLSICLSWVISPLATLPNMFAPTSSLPLVGGLTVCATLLSALHLLFAAQSPHPVLQGTTAGQVIVISTSIIMAFSFSFSRVSVASMLRREGGRKELLWCGAITQLGSFCGAILSFLFVSIFKVFTRLPPCSA